MTHPYSVYKSHKTIEWTRVDMLLELLSAMLSSLRQFKDAFQHGDSNAANALRIRCQRLLVELQAGIDLSKGEVALNTQRLYIFVGACLSEPDEQSIGAAIRALTPIYEGFEQIRPEAIRLESEGVIPPIDEIQRMETVA